MKLVLLPGLDGTGRLFDPLLRALPPHYSHLIVPYPKHVALTYPDLLQVVQGSIPADEDYVLLAESFSGPIAVELAATNPPRLRALLLCASFVSNPAPLPQRLSFLVRKPAFGFHPPEFFIRRYLLGGHAPASLSESLRQALGCVSPEVLAYRVRCVMRVDVRDELQACRMPILYLAAKRDKLVRRRSLTLIQAIKPGVEVVEVEGPHLLLQREPERCAEVIDQFVSRVVRSI